MNENEVTQKLVEQCEAIELIAKELRWILEESTERDIQPNTLAAEEVLRMFFDLYKDFKRVREQTQKLRNDIYAISFTDKTLEMVNRMTADALVKKLSEGIFEQMVSVAEYGCLPDGTTYEDLSS